MQKIHQLRLMFARHVLAIDYNNIVLGYVILDVIENTYLPKLNTKLQRLREEDISDRAKVEQAIALWEKEAKDIKASNKNAWSAKPARAIEGIAAGFGIKDDNTVEEIIQNLVGNLYSTDRSSMNMLQNYDPEKGVSQIQGAWTSRLKDRAKNLIKKMFRDNPETNIRDQATPSSEEGDPIDPIDKLTGDAPVSERELDTFIKQMGQYVLRDSKIKNSDYLTAIYNTWAKAFDKRDDIGSINFKSDVFPVISDRFQKKYPAVLKIFKERIVPVMAKFMVSQMGGNQNFYEKLITSSEDQRPMHERIAEDFYNRDMAAYILEPALRIQDVMRKFHATV